jgi:hypothetical protein
VESFPLPGFAPGYFGIRLKGQAAGMTRNSQQVLGKEVSEEYKSRFLICGTQKGKPKDGTR